MFGRFIVVAFVFGVACACGAPGSDAPAAGSGAALQDAGMKIRVERSGGFAGMTRTFEVDVDALPEEERSAVARMIGDAEFYALPAVIPRTETGGADLYTYRITIESDEGEHTVTTTQLSVPESLQPLIDWLDRNR